MYRNLFVVHRRYGENALVRAKPWLISAGVVALSPLRGGRAEAQERAPGAQGRQGVGVTATQPGRSAALPIAVAHAQRWLDSLDSRPVPPQAQVEEVMERLGTTLPDGPQDAAGVIERLATACEPGLTAMPSGRFYGMVIGGVAPGRPGRGLADQRLGPERRPGPAHPGRHRHRAGGQRLAARPAGAPGRERGRVRHRRHDGQLHLPRGRPRRGAARRRLGHQHPGAGRLARRPRAGRRRAARHRRPGAALPRAGRPGAGRGRRRGPDRPGRPGRRAGGRGRHADRGLPPGRQRPLRRLRPVRRGDRGRAPRTAPGCTWTARSGCSRPRRRRTAT